MSNATERKTLHLDCECLSHLHIVRLTYFPYQINQQGIAVPDNNPEVYLSFHLGTKRGGWFKSFLHRLHLGIRYILGFGSKYGEYDEVVLSSESIDKLKKWCEDHQSWRQGIDCSASVFK